MNFGKELNIFYPAGCVSYLKDTEKIYDPTERGWYKSIKSDFLLTNKSNYILEGPYENYGTRQPILTLTRSIVSKKKEMIGTASIDML